MKNVNKYTSIWPQYFKADAHTFGHICRILYRFILLLNCKLLKKHYYLYILYFCIIDQNLNKKWKYIVFEDTTCTYINVFLLYFDLVIHFT